MYFGKQQMYGQQNLYWVPWWLTWHSIKHVVQILLLSQHVACSWRGRWRMNSDVVFRKSSIYLLNLQKPFFLQNNKMTWIYAHTHTHSHRREEHRCIQLHQKQEKGIHLKVPEGWGLSSETPLFSHSWMHPS